MTEHITAVVPCPGCQTLYTVTWLDDGLVGGLPLEECECGILSDDLEREARDTLDRASQYTLGERDEEVRREGGLDESPSYRKALQDAGRGHLIR